MAICPKFKAACQTLQAEKRAVNIFFQSTRSGFEPRPCRSSSPGVQNSYSLTTWPMYRQCVDENRTTLPLLNLISSEKSDSKGVEHTTPSVAFETETIQTFLNFFSVKQSPKFEHEYIGKPVKKVQMTLT